MCVCVFSDNQTYIGCFADPEKSLFSSYTVVSTAEACKNHCLAEGKTMYGLVLSDAGKDNNYNIVIIS